MNTQIDSEQLEIESDLEQLLKDYNGYDFCGEAACNGQSKANELIAAIQAHAEDYARKLCLEVIGEDEPIEGNATYVLPRNAIRATQRKQLDEILGLFATNLLHPFTCKRNDCYQVLSGEKWHYGIDKTAAKTALTAYVNEQVRAATETTKVTRFEVIDHTSTGNGRDFVKYDVSVEAQLQDGGRTLKVFLSPEGKETK